MPSADGDREHLCWPQKVSEYTRLVLSRYGGGRPNQESISGTVDKVNWTTKSGYLLFALPSVNLRASVERHRDLQQIRSVGVSCLKALVSGACGVCAPRLSGCSLWVFARSLQLVQLPSR